MDKNCPNCGAPYDVKLNSCPYCNTLYFDMSAIDLEECKPLYLKIKYDGHIITQKCIPRLGCFEYTIDTADVTDYCGTVIKRVATGNNFHTNITFEAVSDYGNNQLFTIERND